jgi:hypothetical protein
MGKALDWFDRYKWWLVGGFIILTILALITCLIIIPAASNSDAWWKGVTTGWNEILP